MKEREAWEGSQDWADHNCWTVETMHLWTLGVSQICLHFLKVLRFRSCVADACLHVQRLNTFWTWLEQFYHNTKNYFLDMVEAITRELIQRFNISGSFGFSSLARTGHGKGLSASCSSYNLPTAAHPLAWFQSVSRLSGCLIKYVNCKLGFRVFQDCQDVWQNMLIVSSILPMVSTLLKGSSTFSSAFLFALIQACL